VTKLTLPQRTFARAACGRSFRNDRATRRPCGQLRVRDARQSWRDDFATVTFARSFAQLIDRDRVPPAGTARASRPGREDST
jgi:hypothetical protein